MSSKKNDPQERNVLDYRHKNVTRLNIPPAGLEARGSFVKEKKLRFAYNPHLAPMLRFDPTGQADHIQELLKLAGNRKLEAAELAILEEALHRYEPWLEWAGKREQQWCIADPVALHIHERVSTQAILRVAKREDVQRSLFADPEQEYREAVQFYKHPMDWTNRMILGDSLAVMASLSRREAQAGKVQMIYMDPPYGIRYSSNFQPEVGSHDVKDRDEDLTREPEMVKAYRDTWTLGIHSYLSYLRDRFLLCKELLADTGSIFVQISDENIHDVRCLLDEVFHPSNFMSVIAYRVKSPLGVQYLGRGNDFILWYARDKTRMKYRQLYTAKSIEEQTEFNSIEMPSGFRLGITSGVNGGRPFTAQNLASSGYTESCTFQYEYAGKIYPPPKGRSWKTNSEGMMRLAKANRLLGLTGSLRFVYYFDDFSTKGISNLWMDTFAEQDKRYVVQTSEKVIERCMLMTTDPGDLVLDPTCGSGTTAYVAEDRGRRWITIDVSRVALAIARQRLLVAKYDYYRLRPTSAQDIQRNPEGHWLTDPTCQIQDSCTFDCKTVPHITLKSIAQNQALDPIFEKWEAILMDKLMILNTTLETSVTKEIRFKLLTKLEKKRSHEGKKSVTDADVRRWQLPEKEWKEFEVPFDTDPDWPKALQQALNDYRNTWRQKLDEVNSCIAARADQEELVDQPFVEKNKVRVSGPFTMEGVIPAEESIDDDAVEESLFGCGQEALETFGETTGWMRTESQNSEAYVDRMIRLLRD